MSLLRKTIDEVQIINNAASGYTLRVTFSEVEPAFQFLDLNKTIWLSIMDQADAERGQPYPIAGVAAALVGIRLIFEKASPTSPPVFTSLEFDDVATLRDALALLL